MSAVTLNCGYSTFCQGLYRPHRDVPMQVGEDIEREDAGLPDWYGEIFPNGARDGFFHSWADHAVLFVKRSEKRLLISFDDPQNPTRFPSELDAWSGALARKRDWSHLVIQSQRPRWYRDQNLINLFQTLDDEGFFNSFENVSLIGAFMGGFGSLSFSGLVPGATVVAIDPQSTLNPDTAPWDTRFSGSDELDWTLPLSDAATGIENAGKVYVIYDPFMQLAQRHIDRLSQNSLTPLKAFGCGEKVSAVLQRIGVFDTLLERAITGELQQAEFYRAIRGRKDVYAYSRSMEQNLLQRGRAALAERFRSAFRQRSRKMRGQAQAVAQPAAPEPPDAPDVTQTAPQLVSHRWPRTDGNVWMLEQRDNTLRYMSDQYQGRLMGFEERDGITLAQTPDTAIGIVAFGSGSLAERPFAEAFEFHVLDETLNGRVPATGAQAQGIATQLYKDNAGRALRTILAISAIRSAVTAQETDPGHATYQTMLDRISTARDALQDRGKSLFVDRVALRLLTGEPQLTEAQAAAHYVSVARALRKDIPLVTGQGSFPMIVLSQGAGSQVDGRSEVILAEGRLDLDNPTMKFVVASPSYPFAFMDEMPASHSADAQMLIDELEALAVSERQRGRPWHCPSLRFASLDGNEITAEFTTLSPLIFEGDPGGFSLEGCENDAQIEAVDAEGHCVQVQCNTPPKGRALRLCYAWGASADGKTACAANRGSLRDSWSRASLTSPGKTLFRYALSGRVNIVEAWD